MTQCCLAWDCKRGPIPTERSHGSLRKKRAAQPGCSFFIVLNLRLTSEQVGVRNYTDGGAEPGIAQVGRVSITLHVDL